MFRPAVAIIRFFPFFENALGGAIQFVKRRIDHKAQTDTPAETTQVAEREKNRRPGKRTQILPTPQKDRCIVPKRNSAR